MYYLCVMLLVVGFKKAFCGYHCTMESFEVTCTGLTSNELSQDVSVTLNKPDIVSLNLTNGILPTISETTFQDFTNLETLYVTNCRVFSIQTDSFSHFENLRNLYLGHNNLTDFNVLSLSGENQLILLDLSNNQLKNLSGFDLSHFSKLNVLNLANNFISYLPRNVVNKLEEQNNFYLIVDNNPWDCNNSNWVDYLTPRLRQGFCPNETNNESTVETSSESNIQVVETTISLLADVDNKTDQNTVKTTSESNNQVVDTTISSLDDDNNKKDKNTVETTSKSNKQVLETTLEPQDDAESFLQQFVGDDEPKNFDNPSDIENENERKMRRHYCPKTTCSKCSVYYCISWFAGGIWLGIIFGNLPKIIAMLWSKPKSYSDQSTQCEQHISDQYMISGYHLDFKHGKIKPKTSKDS